jgi:hypothetical protein
MIRKIFNWVFQKQLKELENSISNCKSLLHTLEKQSLDFDKQKTTVLEALNGFDVSVDVHQYSSSWAVFSLQGQKADYVKFVDLGDRDIHEIARFISKYERGKYDATPHLREFIKGETMRIKKY